MVSATVHTKLAEILGNLFNFPQNSGELLERFVAFSMKDSGQKKTAKPLPFRAVVSRALDDGALLGRQISGRFPPSSGMECLALPIGRRVRISRTSPVEPAIHTFRFSLDTSDSLPEGTILCDAARPAHVADMISAHVMWLSDEPLYAGRQYRLVTPAGEVRALVGKLRWRVREENGAHIAVEKLERGAIGRIEVEMDRAIVFDAREPRTPLSFFTLRKEDGGNATGTDGFGVIEFPLRRANNIRWQPLAIGKEERARALGQKPGVVWFTGLSGSGKSTVASLLEEKLYRRGRHCYVLDGDNIRRGLCKDLGFTKKDRIENMRRVAEVAKLMVDAGLIVIVSFISPLRYEREQIRRMFEPDEFTEVFIDVPLEECERRDIKGLYAKARRGEIKNFTGIDSPYEPPLSPELHLRGDRATPEEMADIILEYLEKA